MPDMKANLDVVKGIGSRIASRRRELGLSQAALADLSGASKAGLGNWERDTRLPGCEYLPSLSAALNARLEWLLTGANSMDEYVEKVVAPIQLKRQEFYSSENQSPQVDFTYYPDSSVAQTVPASLSEFPPSPAIDTSSDSLEKSAPRKIDNRPGGSAISAADITHTWPTLGAMSPIQKALLITVAEVIDKNGISDDECLQELFRWHHRK